MITTGSIGVLEYTFLAAAANRIEQGDEADRVTMTDIHDIKPLLEIGGQWPWLAYLACATVLLLLGLAWWFWKHRRSPAEPLDKGQPQLAADEEALTALDALASETGLAPKLFFFRLSAILRRYVERRYSFPAAEMTTEELIPHMDRLPLDHALNESFKSFCREADPIKFAGTMAGPQRAQHHLVFCRNFIYQTREKPQETET